MRSPTDPRRWASRKFFSPRKGGGASSQNRRKVPHARKGWRALFTTFALQLRYPLHRG